MKRRLLPLLHSCLGYLGLLPIYLIGRTGVLKEDGWFRSCRENAAVDANGAPIPWITYPALEFLRRRLRDDMRVFEFGCGNSTLWWAERVREIHSVEHDRTWYDKMRRLVPPNARVEFVELDTDGAYCRTVLDSGTAYDIVVIDGRDRVHCARSCIRALAASGVILWDNTDRAEYSTGIAFLLEHGFRRIEFSGLCPIIPHRNETSIFYRPGNCLGL